jgi:hypothetical protein
VLLNLSQVGVTLLDLFLLEEAERQLFDVEVEFLEAIFHYIGVPSVCKKHESVCVNRLMGSLKGFLAQTLL